MATQAAGRSPLRRFAGALDWAGLAALGAALAVFVGSLGPANSLESSTWFVDDGTLIYALGQEQGESPALGWRAFACGLAALLSLGFYGAKAAWRSWSIVPVAASFGAAALWLGTGWLAWSLASSQVGRLPLEPGWGWKLACIGGLVGLIAAAKLAARNAASEPPEPDLPTEASGQQPAGA
jgi:hypothetical protein